MVFQVLFTKKGVGSTFRCFSQMQDLQEGDILGVERILLLSCVTYRHTAEPFRKNNLQKSCSYHFCFVKSH